MKTNIKSNFIILRKMVLNPVTTLKFITRQKNLKSNFHFLIILNFILLLFEFPKNCEILNIRVFSTSGMYLLVDYALWSIKNITLLTVILGVCLWLNHYLNNNKKNLTYCLSLCTYILLPTTSIGIIYGNILMYVKGNDDTTILNTVDNLVHIYSFIPISWVYKVDFFMLWTVVLLIIAGSITSKISIRKNLEDYILLWTILIFTTSTIFNLT